MPVLPASLIEPLWVEFAALIGTAESPEFDPGHPLGCHRRRVDDRVVFDCVIAALVHGSGYERVAVPGCSDRTIRRRLGQWAARGVTKELLRAALDGYDRMLGLDLDDLSVDGSITKSPCGGEVSGRSPLDRGKQGGGLQAVHPGPATLAATDRRPGDPPGRVRLRRWITTDGEELPLCRLRYGGSASIWAFSIYRASHDDYQPSTLPNGATAGSPEDALDTACSLYLGDPTAWITPPKN